MISKGKSNRSVVWVRNLLRHEIKAKPCMESSRRDVWNPQLVAAWNQFEECTLSRDAIRQGDSIRDCVVMPYQFFELDKIIEDDFGGFRTIFAPKHIFSPK